MGTEFGALHAIKELKRSLSVNQLRHYDVKTEGIIFEPKKFHKIIHE